jgi:hypothetical protein
MGEAMRDLPALAWQLPMALIFSFACASAPPPPPTNVPPAAPDPKSDAKAILAEELGDMPTPKGPCPERTEPNVLTNPRATVQRTALGLAYCILSEGPPGEQVPGPRDTVRVNYSGWNEEGKLFDSSEQHGSPIEFPLNGVIRGWSEGLRLMTPGDKARLWIPGNLAYGRKEPGESEGTPPKGTLIFEVELLEVTVRAAPDPSDENQPYQNKKPKAQPETETGRPKLQPRSPQVPGSRS